MADLTLGITLKADGTGFVGEAKRAQTELAKIGNEGRQAADKSTRGFGLTTSALGSLKAAVLGAVAAYASFNTVKNLIGAVASEVMKSEKATANLTAVLRATGDAAQLTLEELSDLSDELEASTLFDGAEIKQAEAVMLTFKSVTGDTFREAISLSADLAALMGGDLQSAVLQLGKALEDPEQGLSALRRVGVSFTEEQQKLIKSLIDTGDQAKAMRVILDTLAGQIGGVATAQVTGLTGALNTLGDVYGNVLEEIGNTRPFQEAVHWLTEFGVAAREALREFNAKSAIDLQIEELVDQRRQIQEKIAGLNEDSAAGWIDRTFGGEQKLAMYRQRLQEINDALAFLRSAAASGTSEAPLALPVAPSLGCGADAAMMQIRETIEALEFERAQLSRSNDEQRLYNELRKAGVDINSAAGQQIAALVESIQQQTDAQQLSDAAHQAYNETMEEGARLTEEVRTPLEAYIERVTFLGNQLAQGAISQETFNRQIVQAQADLDLANAKLQGLSDGSDFLAGAFSQMGNAAAQSLTDIILQSENAGQALERLGEKLLEIAVQELLIRPLFQLFGAAIGGGAGFGGGFGGFGGGGFNFMSVFSSLFSAKGNVFSGGDVVPFRAGGVVSAPAIFPMASGGIGLMGEAGPEAIMPLGRDHQGRLGVRAEKGGDVTVIVNNTTGQPATATRRQAGDGRTIVEVMVGHMSSDIARRGALAQTLETTYGLSRRSR
jgi:hypothetical protein